MDLLSTVPAALAFIWPAHGIYWIAGAALAAGGLAYAWSRWRGRQRPVRHICSSLSGMAEQLQSDLRQLELEDGAGQLARGWNRLIEEVAGARRELEQSQIRQQARETLGRYEHKWLTQLLNRLPYGVLSVTEDWTVAFANHAAEQLLGVEEGGLKGRSACAFFRQDLSAASPASGATLDQTLELVGGPGLVRLTSVSTAGESPGNGETALLLRDVTAERARDQERSSFLYHVTHELRTPLSIIKAYAETLSEGVLKDPEMLRECYNVIVGEAQRLSRLVEDMLSLSQMEAGAARLNMDDVNIARLIRQVVEDMQASADDKRLELLLKLPAKLPAIRGDKDRLAVVLTNLVGNAVKYTPSGGKVEITCLHEGSRIYIGVKDTGIGINPDERERVFEKFYRSRDERVGALPGTGLGLALALETTRAHGGAITLDSEPGKGSTFTVTLPVGSLAAVPS